MPSGSNFYKTRNFEPLEARLMLSFTEVAAGTLGIALDSSGPFWIDYDNDGWVDAATDHGIFRNLGGTFSRVPGSQPIPDAGQAAYTGDFNNDGWLDIHHNWHGCCPRFLINRAGSGQFDTVEISLPAVVDGYDGTASMGSALGDFNNDGWLDVYIGGFEHWPDREYPDRLILSRPDPTQVGGRNFEMTWQQSPILRARGVTAADFNEDGHIDVYVSNYRLQGNLLWVNDGSGSDFPFTFGSETYNALGDHGHSIGSAFGDLDSDGHLDIFAGNFSHPGQPQSRVLLNQGPMGNYHFTDLGTSGIHWKESWSSPVLADFDNDGMLDVFFSALSSYGNSSSLFRNTGSPGAPQFSEVSLPASVEGYLVSWADWDNDGDMDLATGSPNRFFRNDNNNDNSWLKVALRAPGAQGVNGAAIGAIARVRAGDLIVTRQVEAGTGQGNQSELILHFGLGNTRGPVDVEISWPDGTVRTIQTSVNQTIDIHYGSSPNRDVFTAYEDQVLSLDAATGLLSNDFLSPDGPEVTAQVVERPLHGQVTVNPDGSFQYTPDTNYNGADTFTYRLVGDPNSTGVGWVTIHVEPTQDPPVAVDDVVVVKENKVFATGLPQETVVPFGAIWKYSDRGIDLGTAWQEPAFDDSSWLSGPAKIGYGDGDEQTTVRFDSDSFFATAYFRTDFKATSIDSLNDLTLKLLRDDAAAVYLNGIEIHRDPTLPPDANFNTYVGKSIPNESEFEAFVIDTTTLVEGTNRLAVEVHQKDPANGDMSFDLALDANSGGTVLLPAGSDWKYLANGSNLETAWREAAYDDSGWPEGTAQFGFGDGDEVTEIAARFTEDFKIPTTYFRHTFEVTDADRISDFVIQLVRDDAVAVYLNGFEIVRDNLSSDATFGTYALVKDGIEGETKTFSTFHVPDGMIINGDNVLAAEIHQIDAKSSDISLDLEMIVQRDVELGVLENDIEIDGDGLIAELLEPPQHGTVVMTPSGQFSYTPDAGFKGADSFTYRNMDVAIDEPQTFVEFGSSWRFLDDGSDQGVAWQQPDFNDSTWFTGAAELGYGDGDEVTVLNFGSHENHKHATNYFRTDFEIGAVGNADFTASLLRDDAAAVYVNGVAVYRDTNLISGADYNDYALAAIPDETTPVSFSIPAVYFKTGQNTLAVEVHQASGTSSDMSFDFQLIGFESGSFGSDEGLVTITVVEANDVPMATDDQYSTSPSQMLVVDQHYGVLSNDTDDENDPLSAVVVTLPSHGNLALSPDGSFSYSPDAGFEGQDSFLYRALDGDGTDVTNLIRTGSNWHYLDDGSNQGTAWLTNDFDSSAWSVGEAQLGYGDGDEQTVIGFGEDPDNKHATTYFRKEFNVAVAERVNTLTAWLLRDDGAAVYLNGVEIHRDDGVPANATFDTYVKDLGENVGITFFVSPNLLLEGANVIAVEVHQQAPASSDLSFDFSLTSEIALSTPATVVIDVSSTPSLLGDVNLDGHLDTADIDDMFAVIAADSNDLQYDLDQNGSVESADIDYLITTIFQTTLGDTDLDGDVDTGDLTRAIIGFNGAGGTGKGWADGDTNGDGDVDTGDLTTAIIRFTGASNR